MNADKKPVETDRPRRLADRLCYLAEGDAGLTRRANMLRAIGWAYTDDYDHAARAYLAKEEAAR